VAYDEQLADRIRARLGPDPSVTEQRMFGGLAFLIDGNMAVGVSGQGGLMVRADPTACEQLIATTAATPMEMRGRPMTGWLRVAADDVRTELALQQWVEIGTAAARALPPKPAR
jgi:TfoX/Sxy family transcriptional regulator of competence genes